VVTQYDTSWTDVPLIQGIRFALQVGKTYNYIYNIQADTLDAYIFIAPGAIMNLLLTDIDDSTNIMAILKTAVIEVRLNEVWDHSTGYTSKPGWSNAQCNFTFTMPNILGTYLFGPKVPEGGTSPGPSVLLAADVTRATCAIATAAYGSSLAPELNTLRHFRDNYLPLSITEFYYKTSPPIASFVSAHSNFRKLIRAFLTFFIKMLKS